VTIARQWLVLAAVSCVTIAAGWLQAEPSARLVLEPTWVAKYAAVASGDVAFDHVARLSVLHRLPNTGAYDEAADYVAARARTYGLNVEVRDFPADGNAEYWTWKTAPRWTPVSAELFWVSPHQGTLARFADTPVSLAMYSTTAEVAADVVDVGYGFRSEDYEGKDVKGKLIFTTGFPSMVYAEAVVKRGAAGIVTWYNEATQPDAAAWLSLPLSAAATDSSGSPRTVAFVLSYFQGRLVKQALDRGQQVTLGARVEATVGPGHHRIVSASLPGTDTSAGEVWFSAHLDHQKPGANDNASGAAAILEVARSLAECVRSGALPRPVATIRFLWGPEMIGNVLFLHANEPLIKRVIGAFNLDTVGEHQARLGTSLWAIRPPMSRPHYFADVAENLALFTLRNSRRLLGGRPDGPFLTASGGTRSVLNAAVVPYVGASDHIIFNDGAVAIPSVGYIHYPDPTWHTNRDTLENVDPTTLKRVVFMTGGAALALGWREGSGFESLLSNSLLLGDIRLAHARATARRLVGSRSAEDRHLAALVLIEAYRFEIEVIRSLAVAPQAPSTASSTIGELVRLMQIRHEEDVKDLMLSGASECHAQGHLALGDRRPARTGWRAPLDTYRDVLADRVGGDAVRRSPAGPHLGSVAFYEALNWMDGNTNMREIYHRVAAECALYDYPLPTPEAFSAFVGLLEGANLVK